MWVLVALVLAWLVASPILAVLVGRGMARVEAVRLAPTPRTRASV